jgi:hypothetical protein
LAKALWKALRVELREMQYTLVNLITRHLRFRGFEVETDIEGIHLSRG